MDYTIVFYYCISILLKELMKNNYLKDYKNIETDPKTQSKLFKKYFHKMHIVCQHYAKNNEDAQDILQEGFIKIFANLNTFRNEGSLENWMKRIMINTSFNFYKRKKLFNNELEFESYENTKTKKDRVYDQFLEDDLQKLINDLPEGYKKVFNLSAVQGYTHKEIGKMLNISKNTSKSQLNRAKNTLREKISSIYCLNEPESYYEACLS